MKPDTIASLIRHGCSAVIVACVVACIVLRAIGVDIFAPYGGAMALGTVAAIIGARQPV